MNDFFLAATSALGLGVFTSISPCPLASNIAAISYLSRQGGQLRGTLLGGLWYTLGRTVTYLGLAMLLAGGALAVPTVANFLQQTMNLFLGPLLILLGMILLNMLDFSLGDGISQHLQNRLAHSGLGGAFLLGLLFALTFCPVSAALFFGSLLPLAVAQQSPVALPVLYGVGTALPVLAFALLLAVSVQAVGRAFALVTQVEQIVRYSAGILLVLLGIYLSLKHVFRFVP